MFELREYVNSSGRNLFREWFDALDAVPAARVTVALARIAQGNWSNVKGVGQSVLEFRIDVGPGYRVYFGRESDRIVILLGGGTRKRQHQDITAAQEAWREYKRRSQQRWH